MNVIINADPFQETYICVLFCREDPEDDVYSFGCILLEALMGPKLHKKGVPFVLNNLVCSLSYFSYQVFSSDTLSRLATMHVHCNRRDIAHMRSPLLMTPSSIVPMLPGLTVVPVTPAPPQPHRRLPRPHWCLPDLLFPDPIVILVTPVSP
jgi:hypothetical protein